MSVTYLNSAIAERMEFRLARKHSGMTGHEVDDRAGYPRNTCYLFETSMNPITETDQQKLLDFLQAVVEYECSMPDYRSAVLAYKAKHGVSREEMCRRSGLKEIVLRKLERCQLKSRMKAQTRAKLDALLFAG